MTSERADRIYCVHCAVSVVRTVQCSSTIYYCLFICAFDFFTLSPKRLILVCLSRFTHLLKAPMTDWSMSCMDSERHGAGVWRKEEKKVKYADSLCLWVSVCVCVFRQFHFLLEPRANKCTRRKLRKWNYFNFTRRRKQKAHKIFFLSLRSFRLSFLNFILTSSAHRFIECFMRECMRIRFNEPA